MITLFHGTTKENAKSIQNQGKIKAPCYFTPREDVAADYSNGGVVIKVSLPEEYIRIDLDLNGGKLLSIEDANAYLGNDDWDLEDYLNSGFSVGIEIDVEANYVC